MGSIGKRIDKVIKNSGLSQKDFANKIGVSEQAIGNYINNRRFPKAEILLKMKQTFNVSVDWLLSGRGEIEMDDFIVNEEQAGQSSKKKNLIPLYEDAQTIGGASTVANMDPVQHVSEWIDAGDWFPGATAAIRHYGDSMPEYPSGCILALKEVIDRNLIVWGRNYCIETTEYRVTKRIYDDGDVITACSTNEESYKNGRLMHPPFSIPKKSILKMYMVLGYVVKEYSNGPVIVSG